MEYKDRFRNEYFISYRSSNKGGKIAHNIHKGLEKAGYTNYYNPKQHNQEKAGYPKRLHRNVRHCKVYAWVLTVDCMMARENEPDFYYAEIIWAHKYKKCIVPVMSPEFKNSKIDNEVLKQQFYIAYENLYKSGILKLKDKKVVDEIVKRYCINSNIWSVHDIPDESAFSMKIVLEIIDRISKTTGVYPLKKRWIKIPIIHMAILVVIISIIVGVRIYINIHDQTIWDGTTTVEGGWSSFDGDGSKENPYKIKTAKQLAWLSYTSQSDTFSGKYFELDADITLNHYNAKGIRNENKTYTMLDEADESYVLDQDATHKWTPIGNAEYPFAGSFNGNGHMIYGLLVEEKQDYLGLFGLCDSQSRIINVNVMCATISTPNSYVGGIVGKTDGVVDRCSVYSAMVDGKECVGGIAGEANIITNSFANSWVDKSSEFSVGDYGKCVGGIAGKCGYLINSSGSTMLVGAGEQFTGGLVGEITKGAYNCIELSATTSINQQYYLENDEPITVCSVFGTYEGSEERYSNIYFDNYNNVMLQITKEDYYKLLKKYPDFFEEKEVDDKPFNFGMKFSLKYHEYSKSSGKYNQISKKLNFKTITEKLNDGVRNLERERPDINSILIKYGTDDKPLQLAQWLDSDDATGIFINGLKKSPWLDSVIDIRENWKMASQD